MQLRTIQLSLGAAAFFGGHACFAADWSPTPGDPERYEQIWKSSPFVAATAVTPQAESLAQRYTITGFARLGEREVVFIFDRKALSRFTISKDLPQNGVELISVKEGDSLKALNAKIRVGSEVAVIAYDASAPQVTAKNASVNSPAVPSPASSPTVVTTDAAAPKTLVRTLSRGAIKAH